MKLWSTATADKKAKELVFKRDNYTCVLCKRKYPDVIIDPSHYWGRYVSSTRFDLRNLDTVCRGCHFRIEHAKQGEYRVFKIRQLGLEEYDKLEKHYYQGKVKRRDAIKQLMKLFHKDV